MASDPTSSASPALCQAIKPLVPRRFSINSLHPFSSLFILATSPCLRPQASSTFPPPDPPLQARGPHRRYDEASQKNTAPRDCWLLFARDLGSTLSSTALLWVSPSVVTK